MILVTGDVVLDHNVYAGERRSPISRKTPGTRFDTQPGGALLTFGLLRELVQDQVAFGLGNVSIDELEKWPTRFHVGGLWELEDNRWRLSKNLGYGAQREEDVEPYPGKPSAALEESRPKVLVIDDAALGFRHGTTAGCWPSFVQDPEDHGGLEWIILKVTQPLVRGDLWRALSKHWRDKLIVVTTADSVRTEDARVSQGLSWESTVDEVVDEVQSNPALQGLQACRHLVITFRGEGALWFDQPKRGTGSCRLIFDREQGEGDNESATHRRKAFGYLSAMTASLAWQVSKNAKPALTEALKAGLAATRCLREYGHGRVDADKPGFPFDVAADCIKTSHSNYADVDVPCAAAVRLNSAGDAHQRWSILGREFHSDAFPGPFLGAAHRVALLGPSSLESVPYGRFGKLLTMDRGEIEGLRQMRKQMLAYRDGEDQTRPLSLAVFGAPGSGKSFGLQQIAGAVFGSKNPILEFNLSQFKDATDLIGAFHQIRDHALAGETPVAFWDEFDSRNYYWLQYLLAPMQDGAFQEGQHTHVVGKCVFVFAGGTSRDFAHFGPPAASDSDDERRRIEIDVFRMAKGPDFKSRLSGYLDIVGPNPRSIYDETLARNGLSPWKNDPTDVDFPVRRAILLRALLEMKGDKENDPLEIDRGLLTALLRIGSYRNGARSMKNLVSQTLVNSDGILQRANLPPDSQLGMYVDDVERFHKLMRESYEFQAHAKQLAAAIHQDWRDNLPKSEKGGAYDISFEQLDDEGKQANIAAALRMSEILALVGLRLEPGQATPGEEKQVLSVLNKHLEFLAEEEHKGWEEQKRTEGWTYGDPRDDDRRKHRLLVPYSKLPPEQRDKDRSIINNYAKYARMAGFKIVH